MGLTAWERQRDLLQLKKRSAEKDLAEMKSIPPELFETGNIVLRSDGFISDTRKRHRKLIETIQATVNRYTAELEKLEQAHDLYRQD